MEDLDVRELRDRVGIDGDLDSFASRIKSWTLLKVCWQLVLVIVSATSRNVSQIERFHDRKIERARKRGGLLGSEEKGGASRI